MSGALVVVRPFGRYKVGDVITDTDSVRLAFDSEQMTNVVATRISPQPTTIREG